MRNEDEWNTFARTGRVEDYLVYASNRADRDNLSTERKQKEGERCEGACNGNGAFFVGNR